MKTGFHDPIAKKAAKEQRSPWDFRAPDYDERSSCYVNAGSHNGVGYRNPVGHDGPVKQRVSTLPFGRVNTMQVDDVGLQNLKPEMET